MTLTAQVLVSTMLTPGALSPVKSAAAPLHRAIRNVLAFSGRYNTHRSFVPIHSVYKVSDCLSFTVPFRSCSAKSGTFAVMSQLCIGKERASLPVTLKRWGTACMQRCWNRSHQPERRETALLLHIPSHTLATRSPSRLSTLHRCTSRRM